MNASWTGVDQTMVQPPTSGTRAICSDGAVVCSAAFLLFIARTASRWTRYDGYFSDTSRSGLTYPERVMARVEYTNITDGAVMSIYLPDEVAASRGYHPAVL